MLGQIEQRLLGLIQDCVCGLGLIEALRHDLACGIDHLPQQRLVANDVDVVFDV